MRYTEFKEQRSKAINDFPMFFAFNNEQFAEGKEKLGIKDDEDIVHTYGGGYIRKSDAKDFIALLSGGSEQLEEFLKDDEQFKDALRYELGNHEYIITYDVTDALGALELKFDKLTDRESRLVKEAVNQYLKDNEQNVWG